jgi:hypothetical protein
MAFQIETGGRGNGLLIILRVQLFLLVLQFYFKDVMALNLRLILLNCEIHEARKYPSLTTKEKYAP